MAEQTSNIQNLPDDHALSIDFRRRQFTEPNIANSALSRHQGETSTSEQKEEYVSSIPQNTKKVIVHFDLDAFYAQVEELMDPSIQGQPLGVTQKYLVVTCNYAARKLGIAKLMSTKEAQKRCPQLILRNGEDLTPYRAASRKALKVLENFGIVEKLGMDEFYVDITNECRSRVKSGKVDFPVQFAGHVLSMRTRLRSEDIKPDTLARPQDLRDVGGQEVQNPIWHGPGDNDTREEILWLAAGSHIAAEARAALRAEQGFRASAGISVNKLLSKLAGGLHKPDGQTSIPFSEASLFVAKLPVRVIRGVGYKTEEKLKKLGIQSCEDMRKVKVSVLSRHVATNMQMAQYFHCASFGIDNTLVVAKGPPKSITVEDSFKPIRDFKAAIAVVKTVLVPDFACKLHEDWQEYRRKPSTLILTYRLSQVADKLRHYSRKTMSCPFPRIDWKSLGHSRKSITNTLNESCIYLLKKALVREPFALTLLNVGATNFVDVSASHSLQQDILTIPTMDQLDNFGQQSNKANAEQGILRDEGMRRQIAEQNDLLRRDYKHIDSMTLMSKHEARLLAMEGKLPQSYTEEDHSLELKNTNLDQLWHHSTSRDPLKSILHVDIDCFYCQVERIDDKELCGKPIAVSQFNSGGFVSVSYEARESGIRCGDGVGAQGRQNIEFLKQMKSLSKAEALLKCPNLRIKPMRPDRYREISQSILSLLKNFTPKVEKSSCDDFYLDITQQCTDNHDRVSVDADQAEYKLLGNSTQSVDKNVMCAVEMAGRIKSHLYKFLKLECTIGIARNKTLAKMINHLGKPNGLVVLVGDEDSVKEVTQNMPITSIPSLGGKLGFKIRERLGIKSIAQLSQWPKQDLCDYFGVPTGLLLWNASRGIFPETEVIDRGAPSSMMAERSFPPMKNLHTISGNVIEIAKNLLQRMKTDGRVPSKMTMSWRLGYASPVHSKTFDVPQVVMEWIKSVEADISPESNAEQGLNRNIRALLEILMKHLSALIGEAQDGLTRFAISALYKKNVHASQPTQSIKSLLPQHEQDSSRVGNLRSLLSKEKVVLNAEIKAEEIDMSVWNELPEEIQKEYRHLLPAKRRDSIEPDRKKSKQSVSKSIACFFKKV